MPNNQRHFDVYAVIPKESYGQIFYEVWEIDTALNKIPPMIALYSDRREAYKHAGRLHENRIGQKKASDDE